MPLLRTTFRCRNQNVCAPKMPGKNPLCSSPIFEIQATILAVISQTILAPPTHKSRRIKKKTPPSEERKRARKFEEIKIF